jgi:hypothetical protein
LLQTNQRVPYIPEGSAQKLNKKTKKEQEIPKK